MFFEPWQHKTLESFIPGSSLCNLSQISWTGDPGPLSAVSPVGCEATCHCRAGQRFAVMEAVASFLPTVAQAQGQHCFPGTDVLDIE